jgi:Na+/H+-dicarboxylate symporter
MNSVFKILALLCAALIVAVASFQDSLALSMGKIAMVSLVTAFGAIMLGAGLSLFMRASKKKEAMRAGTPLADADEETSSPLT